MAQVKFGVNQLNNPTPKILKTIFKTVLFISTAWAFLAPTITEIDKETLNYINTWLLRANGLIRIAISFFGLDYEAGQQPAAPNDTELQNQ